MDHLLRDFLFSQRLITSKRILNTHAFFSTQFFSAALFPNLVVIGICDLIHSGPLNQKLKLKFRNFVVETGKAAKSLRWMFLTTSVERTEHLDNV